MADYGKTATAYDPSVLTATGQISKIAKQVLENVSFESAFDVFLKDDIVTGKDLEVTLWKEATGTAYSRTTAPSAPDPTTYVRMFDTLSKETFAVKLDETSFNEAAISVAKAGEIAQKTIQSLYEGEVKWKNDQVMAGFYGATAGSPTTAGTTQIVSAGSLAEIDSEADALAYLLQIKIIASAMRKGSASYNPFGLHVPSNNIVMLIPYTTLEKINAYLKLNVENLELANYGVDKVITYDPDEYSSADGDVYICDARYVQMRRQRRAYAEDKIAGTLTTNAFLHSFYQFAFCNLFNAAVITET